MSSNVGADLTPGAGRRAFERNGLVDRVAPFAASAALTVILAFVEVRSSDPPWLALGALLSGTTVGLALLGPWHRLPPWMDALPPVVYVGAVAALRQATGGASSGFSPVFLVPVLWIALFGTPRQLAVALAAVVNAMAAPLIVGGDPFYPFGEWRRLVNLVTVGATLGFIVQRLVYESHAQTDRALAQGRELAEQRDVNEAILHAASDAVVSFDWSGTVVTVNSAAEVLFRRNDLIGRDVFETLVPDHELARLREGFGRVLLSDAPTAREARFEAALCCADGTLVAVEISLARTDGPAGLCMHAFLRDLTMQRAAERGAQEHLADLDRLLAVSRELDRAVVEGRDAICAAARDLSGCDFVLFFTPGTAGDDRLVVAGSAGHPEGSRDLTLDTKLSVAAQVLRTGEAHFSGDLAADPSIDPAAALRLGAAAAYWQPIVREGLGVGILVAYWWRPHLAIPERVATLLGLFAVQAATVIERSDLLARLEDLARTDALTGAANRRALDEALEVALADARRSGRPVSVTMLDLDYFKRYNDTHGHQAGDQMLRAAAAAWMHELRPGDVLARYGGEEFLAVLRACDVAGAVVVADRMRAVVPGLQTASAGTATWDGTETVSSLIARADGALYQAKDAGRDCTVSSEAARDVDAEPVDAEPRP